MMHNSQYRLTVDRGAYTFLAVCTCGWRDFIPRISHIEAWHAAADHERACHDGRRAYKAYHRAQRRYLRDM